MRKKLWSVLLCLAQLRAIAAEPPPMEVRETDEAIEITTAALNAKIRKRDYVTGVAGGSFVDRKTGFHDAGFGLDIVDWIMEPGSDEAYRDKLEGDLPYPFNNSYHGKTPKRSIEGPQICTKAKQLSPKVTQGKDFVAVEMSYRYHLAAPGKKTGSEWRQTLIFPQGARYFISSDRITAVNSSDAMFLRLDMPGHIKHRGGDTFSDVYLSYLGHLAPSNFLVNFAPDQKFNYRRGVNPLPKRFIRAYRLRDPKTGADGPWLAGMTLDPTSVYEAWCHQRDYVCLIEEIGGRPIRPGESFGAAFLVGYFDSVEEMEMVYDKYAGHDRLEFNRDAWKLVKSSARADKTGETQEAFLRLLERPRVPLSPQERPLPSSNGLARVHFSFASEATQRVPGILAKTEQGNDRRPVVVALHGTGSNKESQTALLNQLAQLGFIGVAIDGRYHGERTKSRGGSAEYSDAILRAWDGSGEHPFLYDTVWDIMRLVDYLSTRNDVDPTRIGLIGFSKGGMETYLAAAADPRIAVAVPCIGVQSFRWALDHEAWKSRIETIQSAVNAAAAKAKSAVDTAFIRRFYDRVVPGIYGQFDGPAMLPLIAPRPLLVINGDSDPRTPVEGVRECADAARKAYALAGATNSFQLLIEENTGHKVTADAQRAAVEWFVKWLRP
jgi:dienelactone hydrolase